MASLSAHNQQVLNDVARQLRVANPVWLRDMIYFETAGTFNPKQRNLGGSSARGLIQFMDSTAQSMGYAGSQDLVDRHPTFESQMRGPVYEYLRPYSPFNKESDLYMAVFYPAARRYSTDTTFAAIFKDRGAPPSGRGSYAEFIKANPGILSPAHYVAKVKKKPLVRRLTLTGGGILAGALVILIIWKARQSR